jgi:hypothetical protein
MKEIETQPLLYHPLFGTTATYLDVNPNFCDKYRYATITTSTIINCTNTINEDMHYKIYTKLDVNSGYPVL